MHELLFIRFLRVHVPGTVAPLLATGTFQECLCPLFTALAATPITANTVAATPPSSSLNTVVSSLSCTKTKTTFHGQRWVLFSLKRHDTVQCKFNQFKFRFVPAAKFENGLPHVALLPQRLVQFLVFARHDHSFFARVRFEPRDLHFPMQFHVHDGFGPSNVHRTVFEHHQPFVVQHEKSIGPFSHEFNPCGLPQRQHARQLFVLQHTVARAAFRSCQAPIFTNLDHYQLCVLLTRLRPCRPPTQAFLLPQIEFSS